MTDTRVFMVSQICGLRTHGILNDRLVTEIVFIHDKIMIVDDRAAIIGSANINDRSLCGDRDSEVAVVFRDEEFIESKMDGEDYTAGRFVLHYYYNPLHLIRC